MGGSFLVDHKWIEKTTCQCSATEVVFVVGGGNGQLATVLSEQCRVILAEPEESMARYFYSLGLYRTMVINAAPEVVVGDMPFDRMICLQPSLVSKKLLEAMIRVPFRQALMMIPEHMLSMFKARDMLGVLLRSCYNVEHLGRVPKTAFSPQLDQGAQLTSITPNLKGDATAKALRLLVQESGTMRGLLTRSCREFYGYTLAEAVEAVRMLDKDLLKKTFVKLTEEEFKDVHKWLRLG